MAENMVTLTLAGPVSADQAEKLHAKEVKDYPTPGMKITLPRGDAATLIDAGYAAGVEPSDRRAVADALGTATSSKTAAKTDTSKTVKS